MSRSLEFISASLRVQQMIITGSSPVLIGLIQRFQEYVLQKAYQNNLVRIFKPEILSSSTWEFLLKFRGDKTGSCLLKFVCFSSYQVNALWQVSFAKRNYNLAYVYICFQFFITCKFSNQSYIWYIIFLLTAFSIRKVRTFW